MNKETRNLILGMFFVWMGIHSLENLWYNNPIWLNVAIVIVSIFWFFIGWAKIDKSEK
jgi:hypothetical protein